MTSSPQFLINGRADASISPMDRGFSYGDGVFRTLAIENAQPINWLLHYNKLMADCNRLSIVCPSQEALLGDIQLLFAHESQAVAKIVISRGEAARGYAVPTLAQPTRVIIKSAMPQYPHSYFEEGVRLHLCKLRLPHQPALAGIKHLNRLENILARMEWNDAAIVDGLLLDVDGHAIECTMSNVFARFGQQLLTPDLEQCGVAGVTRQRILDHAQDLGLTQQTSHISLEQLLQADEVIICNSLYGAWQVISLAGRIWNKQDTAMRLRHLLKQAL